VKKHTRWRDGQLDGRIEHRPPLPTVLSEEELTDVVRANLPAADAAAVTAIADHARNKERCLGALTAVVKRAKFIAEKHGRTQPNSADIANAIHEKGFAKPTTPLRTAAAATPARSKSPSASLPQGRAITPAEKEAV